MTLSAYVAHAPDKFPCRPRMANWLKSCCQALCDIQLRASTDVLATVFCCHLCWALCRCHVMERESFTSLPIAKLLNDNFVSIKVDKEERGDVDRVYMTYVQVLLSIVATEISTSTWQCRPPSLAGSRMMRAANHSTSAERIGSVLTIWEYTSVVLYWEFSHRVRQVRHPIQATSGSGGWPMSVFLTPELHPFLGGTYFPPTDAYGRPGRVHGRREHLS